MRSSSEKVGAIAHDVAMNDMLRITVIGGGPVGGLFSDLEWRLIVAAQQASDKIDNIALNKPLGLIFSFLISSCMSKEEARIRIYDHRWHMYKGRVKWKGPQRG